MLWARAVSDTIMIHSILSIGLLLIANRYDAETIKLINRQKQKHVVITCTANIIHIIHIRSRVYESAADWPFDMIINITRKLNVQRSTISSGCM